MTKINTQTIEQTSYIINGRKLNYIFEENSLWLSKEDLANIFNMDIASLTSHIYEYFYDTNFSVDSNIQNVYNPKNDNYISFLKLDFIISIWYRLKLFKHVREIINLNRTIKTSKYAEFQLPLFKEETDIDFKIQTIDKAISLIKNLKSYSKALF